mmetsp:Transcript_29348/g.42865  ORF Transcript_29348/g.42865 Transcript_29348/m.42865 type:complete len:810 (+) Transcript_29348:221-2650(+)
MKVAQKYLIYFIVATNIAIYVAAGEKPHHNLAFAIPSRLLDGNNAVPSKMTRYKNGHSFVRSNQRRIPSRFISISNPTSTEVRLNGNCYQSQVICRSYVQPMSISKDSTVFCSSRSEIKITRLFSSLGFFSTDNAGDDDNIHKDDGSTLDQKGVTKRINHHSTNVITQQEEQQQFCNNITNHFLTQLVKDDFAQDKKEEKLEHFIHILASAALMPVFYSSTESTSSHGKNQYVDAEKALKRCLRRYEKENRGRKDINVLDEQTMRKTRNEIRKGLADLILGTSVMRLRHWHIFTTMSPQNKKYFSSHRLEEHVQEDGSQSSSRVSNIRNECCDYEGVFEPIRGVRVVSPQTATTQEKSNLHKHQERTQPLRTNNKKGNDSPSSFRKLLYQRFDAVYNLVHLHSEYLQMKNIEGNDNDIMIQKGEYSEMDETSRKWPSDHVDFISTFYSLPLFIAHIFVDQYEFHEAAQLAAIANEPGPVTLRRNALRCPSDETLCNRLFSDDSVRSIPLRSLLNNRESPSEIQQSVFKNILKSKAPMNETPSNSSSLINKLTVPPRGCVRLIDGNLTSRKKSIWSMEAWKDGWFEVQDAGSQLIVEATGAKMGEIVIDYCAGNGGKTLGLASMMFDKRNIEDGSQMPPNVKSHIIAHDVVKERLRQIEGSLERAGLGPSGNKDFIIKTTHDADADLSDGMADVVLVDAPCSSLGVLRRRPAQRWLLSKSYIDDYLPSLQLEILKKAARFVKKNGGRLVYATCSIYKHENEGVVNEFESSSEFHDQWERWDFPGGMSHFQTLLPSVHDSDGFFIARWKRR